MTFYVIEEYEHMSPVGEITMVRVRESGGGPVYDDCMHIDEAQALANKLNAELRAERRADDEDD
jgi:hypothetical protein